jgi:hypothetical protein
VARRGKANEVNSLGVTIFLCSVLGFQCQEMVLNELSESEKGWRE